MRNLLFIIILALQGFSDSKIQPKENLFMENELIIQKKVDSLMAKMTLKEKVGQMLNIGLPSVLKGDYWDARDSASIDDKKFQKFIVDYAVGSIHNTPQYLAGTDEWYQIVKKIQDASKNHTRLKIPVLYGI
ncbi:MAG: hypothetical protein R6V74_04460, partial [Lutibacter sp.]